MRWQLHRGAWADAPDPPPGPCVVIADPPYDIRTHRGRETGSARAGINYEAMTECEAGVAVHAIVHRWEPEWVVLFGSHVTWTWYAEALGRAGYYTFAPVVWAKPDCAPRKQGDGPDSSVEWIVVARPRRKLRRYCHRPGYYLSPTASTRGGGFAGAKPLGLMRKLIRDYSEPGDTVMDPYAGTGTTLLAALLERRRAWGAEIDPATWRRARQRIIDEYDRQPGLPLISEAPARQMRLIDVQNK